MLDQTKLKSLVHYDPVTGNMRNLKRAKSVTCLTQQGYVCIALCGAKRLVHRVAWCYVHGYWPTEIDHINRDRTDNRLENLREVTRLENMTNKGLYSNNFSGTSGVIQRPNGSWRASIKVQGKMIQKSFSNKSDALAYRAYLETEMRRQPDAT